MAPAVTPKIRRGSRRALVEDHGDVGAETHLDIDGALRRQQVKGAVEVRAEFRAFFMDAAQRGEAEHLIATAVGQDRQIPSHEPVKSAAAGNELVAGPQIKVVGIAEDDLGAHLLEVALGDGFHRAARANRHEGGGLDDPVRRRELAAPRGAVAVHDAELKSSHSQVRITSPSALLTARGAPPPLALARRRRASLGPQALLIE
jgi:hypothetical protein